LFFALFFCFVVVVALASENQNATALIAALQRENNQLKQQLGEHSGKFPLF